MTSSEVWGERVASRYDADTAGLATPEVLGPTVDLLAELAGSGAALEFAIGTGRVGIPLRRRGVPVTGIELSEPMARQLRSKVDEATLPVVIGDMATMRVPGKFTLVYLVYNTINNLLTQQEQLECFRNAARHLAPGGRFVIEVGVPKLRQLPPGQTAVPFAVGKGHLGFDTLDVVTQRMVSHHYWREPDGTVRYDHGQFRYIWPAECDLMAHVAGLELERRSSDWHGSAFAAESTSHVSIWTNATNVPGTFIAS